MVLCYLAHPSACQRRQLPKSHNLAPWVKVVVSEADEATISARELVIDIPEEDMLTVIQPGDDLVSFVILHAIRIRGSGTAGRLPEAGSLHQGSLYGVHKQRRRHLQQSRGPCWLPCLEWDLCSRKCDIANEVSFRNLVVSPQLSPGLSIMPGHGSDGIRARQWKQRQCHFY